MTYTKETLESINQRYCSDHYINEKDINKVNGLVQEIEAKRADEPVPQDGDIVICISRKGETVSERGHLEDAGWQTDGKLAACVDPYVPFIAPGSHCSASGGYWFQIAPAELEYVGKQQKRFCTWGHFGPTANGAVDFLAEVNVWRVIGAARQHIY